MAERPRLQVLESLDTALIVTVEEQMKLSAMPVRSGRTGNTLGHVSERLAYVPPYFFDREFVTMALAQEQVDVRWHRDLPNTPEGFAFLGQPLEYADIPAGLTRDILGPHIILSGFYWLMMPSGKDIFIGFVLIAGDFRVGTSIAGGVWNEGELLSERIAYDEDDYDGNKQPVWRLCAPIFAQLIVMAGQRITTIGQQRLGRNFRRRGYAAATDGYVRTVHLRRRERTPTTDTDAGEPVDWSHRWLVRGHWRQQWYPTRDMHQPIWVPPYVKGPDDKPLVVKQVRYAVDR